MNLAQEIPNGICGEWSIIGPIKHLLCNQTIYMADVPIEQSTQQQAIDEAKSRGGKILTTGLGLGMFPDLVLESNIVESVTIIEKNLEVINLVWPTLYKKHKNKIIIILADALEWEPTSHYNVIWHDIWPIPYGHANNAEKKILEPKYKPWCDWQGFWETE